MLTTPPLVGQGPLRDVFADVFREHLVDQRLVADVAAARFLAERLEDARINADRNQSSRFITERRPPDPSHHMELFRRRLGNVRVVNPSRRTPRVRGDSMHLLARFRVTTAPM